MYELTEQKAGKTIKHYFTHEQDYKNYLDYMENGLKIVRRNGNTYYFNNGAIVYMIEIIAENNALKPVLHLNNRTIRTGSQLKKYQELINKVI